MKTEKELREQIKEHTDRMQEIINGAENEDRDLTDEERKEFDGLEDKVKEKRSQIEDVKRKEKLQSNKEWGDQPMNGKPDIKLDSSIMVGEKRAPDWKRRTVRFFNALAMKNENSVKADKMMANLQAETNKMGERQFEHETEEAISTIEKASISDTNKAVLKAVLGAETRVATTSTTDTDKTGYLLPKPFLANVFVIIERYGVARRNFRSIPMTSKNLDLKDVVSKVTASWTDEATNITASDMAMSEGQLIAKKLGAITSWSLELSEDEAIPLLPVLQTQFGESFAEKEDKAAFLGDGTATYGSFTGLTQLANAQDVTFSTGQTDATSLDEAYLRTARDQLTLARQMGGKWFMHPSTKSHIAQLENSAGYRIFQEMINGPEPDQLLGHPIVETQVLPSYTSVGAGEAFIVFGNPMRALMGRRRGMTADISREAVIEDGSGNIVYNSFQADGAILRLTERLGFKVPSAFEDAFSVIKTAAS